MAGMMKKILPAALGLLFLITGFASAGGDAEKAPGSSAGPEAADYLKIAALMIQDGHYERAETALNSIDPDDPAADRFRYYSLRGILKTYREDYPGAVEDLEEALRQDGPEEELLPYLVYGYYMNKDNTNTYSYLTRALKSSPHRMDFRALEISLLLTFGLTHEADARGRKYIDLAGNTAEAYLLIGETLRQQGAVREAAGILEDGAVLFPADADICHSLALGRLQLGDEYTAEKLLARAALLDPAYAPEAADFYARRGNLPGALYYNSLIPEEAVRLRQRFTFFTISGEFERALTLEPDIAQYSEEDPGLLYTRAYMHYHLGNYGKALELIGDIPPGTLAEETRELKEAVRALR